MVLIQGVTNLVGKLAGKRLELLKQAVPKVARVAVIYEPATPANVVEVKEDLPSAARVLKLAVQLGSYEIAAGSTRHSLR
jgi:putative tryptophan/tyrosine transport system substrate-binding protein